MISASFAGMDEQVTAATMTWNENYRSVTDSCASSRMLAGIPFAQVAAG